MGTGADSSPDTTGGALAERLNYLFANMHPPGAPTPTRMSPRRSAAATSTGRSS
ncbi:hypothetical protein NKH77_03210 [Streptomyces sp. M19]